MCVISIWNRSSCSILLRNPEMIFSLFRYTFRTNWPLVIIFSLIISAYVMLTVSMYDMEIINNIQTVIKMYPPELMASIGMDKIPASLTDFVASYIYDFLTPLVLAIYATILPLRLIVRFVDRGSMAFLLSTPHSRLQIALTQVIYMILSLFLIFLIITVSGIAFGAYNKPGDLDIVSFISLNFTAFLLSMALSSITFFFSCHFNTMQNALIASASLLSAFFVLFLAGKFGHHRGVYHLLELVTVFYLLPSREIVNGDVNLLLNNAILIVLSITLITGGLYRFNKKDLPL